MVEKGLNVNKVPTFAGQDLDLYKLYNFVQEKGGFSKVSGNVVLKFS